MAKSNKEIIVKVGANTAEFNRAMKGINNNLGQMQKQMAQFGSMMAGALSVGAVVAFASASLQAGNEQIKVNQKLLAALGGREDVQKRLLAQAEDIRSKTGLDDAAIIQVQAFAAAQGRSEQQIKKNTVAAVQLAAATGIDLLQAMKQVDATMEGNVGRLGKLDARFKELTTSQLENGAAVDLILEKYKGLAESQATDLELLSSNWGEFQEQVGIALGTVLIPLLKEANGILKGLNSPDVSFIDKLLAFTNINGAANLQATARAMEDIRKQMDADNTKADMFVKNMTSLFPTIQQPDQPEKNKKPKTPKGDSQLVAYVKQANEAYRKAQELAEFDVPIPVFGVMNTDLTLMQGNLYNVTDGMLSLKTGISELEAPLITVIDLVKEWTDANYENLNAIAFGMSGLSQLFKENTIAYKLMASAEATISTWLAVANIMASTAKLGPVAMGIAIAGTITSGLAAVAKINGVGLAEGGIVPDGYPNDSYPAMLSSKEIVIPAKRLPDFQQQTVIVKGVIRAGDIYLSNERGAYLNNRKGL